jgi:hypothetical protein
MPGEYGISTFFSYLKPPSKLSAEKEAEPYSRSSGLSFSLHRKVVVLGPGVERSIKKKFQLDKKSGSMAVLH